MSVRGFSPAASNEGRANADLSAGAPALRSRAEGDSHRPRDRAFDGAPRRGGSGSRERGADGTRNEEQLRIPIFPDKTLKGRDNTLPMDRHQYPPDWNAISKRIREREQNRCKWCSAPNGEWVWRELNVPNDAQGQWWRWEEFCEEGEQPNARHRIKETAWGMSAMHSVKVVLTVAHLGVPHADGTPGDKHDKLDVRDENLAALCQRCHLMFDLADHVRHATETRRRKKICNGQMELP